MSNILGYQLDSTTFFVHTSNTREVARLGSSDLISHVRLYSGNSSNGGYRLETIQRPTYSDFSINFDQLAQPCISIQGYSGRVGVGTTDPQYTLTVAGDVFIEGQLYQKGSNLILQSETILSSVLYADFIYSCNIDGAIDFTLNNVKNIKNANIVNTLTTSNLFTKSLGIGTSPPLAPLHVRGEMRVDDGPCLHVMHGMQRVHIHAGQQLMKTGGTKKYGFTLSWVNDATSSHIFEVSGSAYMTGNTFRQYHKFSALINPANHAPSFPGLDMMTDERQVTSVVIGKTRLHVIRQGAKSVQVYLEWNTQAIGYSVNMKLQLFAPESIGSLAGAPFFS